MPTTGPIIRRRHKRVDVCVPVELRVLDAETDSPVSTWMHGIARDVSQGGMRLHLLGQAETIFAESTGYTVPVELRAVPDELRQETAVRGEVRWSRSRRRGIGWTIGIRLVRPDQAAASRLVAGMLRYRSRKLTHGILRPVTLGTVLLLIGWSLFLCERARQTDASIALADCEESLATAAGDLEHMSAAMATHDDVVEELDDCLNRLAEEQGAQAETPEGTAETPREIAEEPERAAEEPGPEELAEESEGIPDTDDGHEALLEDQPLQEETAAPEDQESSGAETDPEDGATLQ